MNTSRFSTATRGRVWFAAVAIILIACDDSLPSAPVTAPEEDASYAAAAETEAEAWSRAYDRLLETESTHMRTLMAHLAWSHADGDHSEFVKTWTREKAADRLRPRIRCGNALREGLAAGMTAEEMVAAYGVPVSAETRAAVVAMNGLAEYLRRVVAGRDPSPRLLDAMRNSGLTRPDRSWMDGMLGGE